MIFFYLCNLISKDIFMSITNIQEIFTYYYTVLNVFIIYVKKDNSTEIPTAFVIEVTLQ